MAPVPAAPSPVVPLGPGTRAWLRIRHGVRLAREVVGYASEQRIWWLVPAVTVIALFALAAATTTTALPVAVYALF
jgi:hypothetical protein